MMKQETFSMGLQGSLETVSAPVFSEVTALDDARRMARRMLECARPHHESLLGYAMVCSEWRLYGFHTCTGPLFDEVNALRAVWWGEGLACERATQCLENVAALLAATDHT